MTEKRQTKERDKERESQISSESLFQTSLLSSLPSTLSLPPSSFLSPFPPSWFSFSLTPSPSPSPSTSSSTSSPPFIFKSQNPSTPQKRCASSFRLSPPRSRKKRKMTENSEIQYDADDFQKRRRGVKNASSSSSSSSSFLFEDDLMMKVIQIETNNHQKEKERIKENLVSQFPLWFSALLRGHSILLYGYGSKKQIIEAFLDDGLDEAFPCIVVNGYHKAFQIKDLLNEITCDILDYPKLTFPSSVVQCDFIQEYFIACKNGYPRRKDRKWVHSFPNLEKYIPKNGLASMDVPAHLFLAIHNIEKAGGSSQDQTIFSLLASIPQIHLIASIDHIFASLSWDDVIRTRYNWMCVRSPTYQPYFYETRFDTFAENTSANREKCILQTLLALNGNSRSAFKALAKFQIANPKTKGMSFDDWFDVCFEELILSDPSVCLSYLLFFISNTNVFFHSDHLKTLQGFIREYTDHEFVKKRRMKDGQEVYWVEATEETLKNIMSQIE